MINYLDRTVLAIAAPFLTADLALTAAQIGLAFSAFSWSYALLQIPGGICLCGKSASARFANYGETAFARREARLPSRSSAKQSLGAWGCA